MPQPPSERAQDGFADLHNVLSDDVAAIDPATLAERYVALLERSGREPSPHRIRELWAPKGEHVHDPPRELRQAVRALGFEAPALGIRGYAALKTSVARAYDEFVAPGEYVFRPRTNAAGLDSVVKFNWEIISTVAGVGLEVLELNDEGRITTDYQFIEADR